MTQDLSKAQHVGGSSAARHQCFAKMRPQKPHSTSNYYAARRVLKTLLRIHTP